MVNYLLSAIAQQDIISIRDYTMETWGQEQVSKYLSQLEERFEWLVKNPHSGKKRDDVKEGYRCFQEGRHVIFYRISKVGIEIIGIPHQSEDIEQHFNK